MFKDLPWNTAATYGGSTFKLVDGQWQMQSQWYHYNAHEVHSWQDAARNIANFLGMPWGISAGFTNVEYNPVDYYIKIVY